MRVVVIVLALASVLSGLSGCATVSVENSQQASPLSAANKLTLGEVYFEPLPLDHTPLAQPKMQAMRDAYKALLALIGDSQTKKHIKQIVQYRLADLEVALAEQKQENGQPIDLVPIGVKPADTKQTRQAPQKLFDLAILQYQQLLVEHPHNPENADVLYQLAKAYEHQGQMQDSFATLQRLLLAFPDNPYLAEIHFRIGEAEFNHANYPFAIAAYDKVLAQGEHNPYYGTATYMLGWSYFKNQQHVEALKAFTGLLDHKLPNDIVAKTMLSQVDSQDQIDSLAVGDKRLVNDTIRIMSVLFSYLNGSDVNSAHSVTEHFARVQSRHYEYVLYDALAQHYLNKDRYSDSAKAYQSFTDIHGDHFQAPIFAVKKIDVYILGEFPTLVLPAKQNFVMRYGIAGVYWPNWPIVLQEQIAPYLSEYLQELALFEHSRGQMLSKASQKAKVRANTKASRQNRPTAPALKEQARQAYLLAAQWYQQFILTFPRDDKSPESTYRLGEALYAAEQYEQSIGAFEDYAYQHLQPDAYPHANPATAYPKAAEAAYSAILAYQQIQ
ncbi:MAG: tetratricopeptide repeat protein, partial [Paraglaciecola sp.]|nr:tetratricopeptide repeat protein [Paraglaciecola sp.]